MPNQKRTLKQFTTAKSNFLGLPWLTQLAVLTLGMLSLGLLMLVAWNLFNRNRTFNLTLAAGSSDGESYILSQAIAQVVENQYPRIHIRVVKTGGTTENLQFLEVGKAQLATAQADISAGPSARSLAILYQDLFQLVVKENSRINEFDDLRGKRIGLQKKGGQYRSFLKISEHYGLSEQNFYFVGDNEEQANRAFYNNQADAIFRVRAPGNRTVLEMVQQHRGRLVAIDQAAAMKIKYPAFEAVRIPKGTYQGSNPPVPASDLPTIGVQRLLLARQNLDNEVIQAITSVIDGHRQEIADAIPQENSDVKPLVASFSRPTTTGGTGIPIHPGAIAYYDRNKPSFIQENSDSLGLLITMALLIWSWLVQLKRIIEKNRKDKADAYIQQTISLIDEDDPTTRSLSLGERQKRLDDIFELAAKALVTEGISQESFRTFNEAYKTVREALERKMRG
jgi:TRAP transporter TAXI family solute receptor